MGFVDNAKSAREWLTDRVSPERVVFHHVPKCGGTSVARKLRMRYLISQETVIPISSYRAVEAFSGDADRRRIFDDARRFRQQMMLYHMYEDVRCISAHVRFSTIAHDLFRSRYKFFTVLRHPVARFISHYFYSYGRADQGQITESLEDFIETPRGKRFGAYYPYFFSDLEVEDYSDPEVLAAAVENLSRFDLVGVLEQQEELEEAVSKLLGFRFRMGHENRGSTSKKKRDQTISTAVRARIEELCQPSMEIYELALQGLTGASAPGPYSSASHCHDPS